MRWRKGHAYVVQLVVEPTCVADGFTVWVPPPERGVGRLAVGTSGALTTGRGLKRGSQHYFLCDLYDSVVLPVFSLA